MSEHDTSIPTASGPAPDPAGTPAEGTAGAPLPPESEMWRAFRERDASYDGVFVAAVRTTGIFCRPTCAARTPNRENVEFFATVTGAEAAGYRACRRCRPLEPRGAVPDWLRGLLEQLERDPARRHTDAELKAAGYDPVRVRRWFQKHHGMTFHAYQRARRVGRALEQLSSGEEILETAYRNGYESPSGFNDAVRRLAGAPPGAARGTRVVHLTRIPTPLGPVVVGATADALCLLEFDEPEKLQDQVDRLRDQLDAVVLPGSNPIVRQAARELDEYFAGSRQEFRVPLLMAGTPFQEAAWTALRAIPYGETRSYGDQARAIGRPRAVRAVAQANGANRIAIIIPCHRVIGADGTLTGYGGGLWRKKRLLALERGEIALPL
jgi:AraC family transcriptional regulator of adaptative response/methylated-DNA-[protein]-cysteine methyltransferase